MHTLYINKARPWENGYVESFNGNLRDELLDRELFLGLDESRYVLDHWRNAYNHRRPHSGIGWQTPTASAVSMNDAYMTFLSATLADPPVGSAPLLRLSRRVPSTRFSHSNWYENGEGGTHPRHTKPF